MPVFKKNNIKKRYVKYVVLGAIAGYFLVHPILMITAHLMQETFFETFEEPGHSFFEDVEETFLMAYSPNMKIWGLGSALFTTILGIFYAKNRQYQKDLEHSNRMKDLYNDILTHDLLNPASAILNVKNLLMSSEKEEQEEILDIVEESAEKQLEIIELAKKLTKLENKESLDKELFDLKTFIRIAIDETADIFKESKIKVENNISGEYPLLANKILINAFNNILTNAAKYSKGNTTTTVDIDEAGKNWLLSFKDQGVGIPDKYKTSVFNRFSRNSKGGVKGTGLGLAIVKRIIYLHDGRVWIEDNPEKRGSVFYISLPKSKNR